LIDGTAMALSVRARVTAAVAALQASHGLQPGLAVVLVGEDPASQIYVRSKGEQTAEAGMHSVTHRLAAQTPEAELLALIGTLNQDPAIHGILVQLPLPGHIDSAKVIGAIDPDKDVDGLHVVNAGRLVAGLPGLVPCTPLGSMIMLRETLSDLTGQHAVVVGRSNLVGKPIAHLLLAANCTVTIAHSRTRELGALCRTADILVAAVGKAEMVRGDWVKPGAVVIDVGINRLPARDPEAAKAGKTRVVGDVAFAEAKQVASAITPVPGGVGKMTVACLLSNTVTAAARIKGVAVPAELGG
jgi:methylenetetrahydrofolate dehydrogenase (NADP+)/methenyltetrahydrofolate cyclohydrolase